ncbi:MAG: leucine-rich repeat domain-containing protein, partial [Spirochaetaceae bacterium]|nr:leucine-rich repeat domain-containing protein [Spirochaetaceae bacterium]
MRLQKLYLKVSLLLTFVAFVSCGSNFVTLDEHKVSVDSSIVGGRIKVSANMFAVGSNVDVQVIPDVGYTVVENSLNYTMGKRTVPIRKGYFTMPAGDVFLSAQFTKMYETQIETEEIIYFQGDMIYEPTIKSNSDSYSLEWHSEDISIVDLGEVAGRPLARNFLGLTLGGSFGRKSGSTKVVLTSSEGAQTSITVVSLPRYFTINSEGVITAVSSDYKGGELFIPSCIDGMEVRGIGNSVFSNKNITSVVLPPTLKSIGDYSFRGNNIETLTLPASLETIGTGAFLESGLVEVNLAATMPSQSYIADDAFGSSLISIVVETEGLASYRRALVWEKYVTKLTSKDAYRMTISQLEFGSITLTVGGIEVASALPGEEVLVSVRSDETHQYSENTLRYMGMSSGRVSLITFDDIRGFIFKMPAETILIMADFETRDFNVNVDYLGPSTDGTTGSVAPPADQIEKWGVVSVTRDGDSLTNFKMVAAPNTGYVIKSVIVNYKDGDKVLFEVPTERVGELVYRFSILEDQLVADGTISVDVVWDAVKISLLFSTKAGITKVAHAYGRPLPALPISVSELNSHAKGMMYMGFFDAYEGGNCYYSSDGQIINPDEPFAPAYFGTEMTFYAQYEPVSVLMTVRNGQPMGITSEEYISAAREFAQGTVTTAETKFDSPYARVSLPQIPDNLVTAFKNYQFAGYFKDPSDIKTQTHDRYGQPISGRVSDEIDNFEVIGLWEQKRISVKVDFGFDVKNLPSTNEAYFTSKSNGIAGTCMAGVMPPVVDWPVPYRPTFRCVGLYDVKNTVSSQNKLGNKYYDVKYSTNGPADGTGEIVIGKDGFPTGASLVPCENMKVKCSTDDNVLTLYPAWNFEGIILEDNLTATSRLRELKAGVHTYGIFKDITIDQVDNRSAISLVPEKANENDKTAAELIGGTATTVLRLFIEKGATLTAKAGKSYGSLSGRAGIHVPVGTRLEIYGGGTLVAEGGYTDPAHMYRFGYNWFDYDDYIVKDAKYVGADVYGPTHNDRYDGNVSIYEAWLRATKLLDNDGKLGSYLKPTDSSYVFVRDATRRDPEKGDIYVKTQLTSTGDVVFEAIAEGEFDRPENQPVKLYQRSANRFKNEGTYTEDPTDEKNNWGGTKTSEDEKVSVTIGPDYAGVKDGDVPEITYEDLCLLWLPEDGFILGKTHDGSYSGDDGKNNGKNDHTSRHGGDDKFIDFPNGREGKEVPAKLRTLGAWGTPGSGAAIGSHGGLGGLSGAAGHDGYPAGEILIADAVSLELTVHEGLPIHGGMGGGGNNIIREDDREGTPGGGGGGGGGVGAPI